LPPAVQSTTHGLARPSADAAAEYQHASKAKWMTITSQAREQRLQPVGRVFAGYLRAAHFEGSAGSPSQGSDPWSIAYSGASRS
jgi:hypothetical protein